MIKKTKIRPHCRRCGVQITQQKEDEALKNKFIPLCEKCEPEIKEKLKKWTPKFQQFGL